MIIKSKNFELKLEEILKDDLPTERYNEWENIVINLIKKWYDSTLDVTYYTSGSTGKPKKLSISKSKIEMSAKATMDHLDPKGAFKTTLLCLNPHHIGGAMVVYRAILYGLDLTIIAPGSEPLKDLPKSSHFDLVSLVPLQFNSLKRTDINRFNTILIGGAPMQRVAHAYDANIYVTFGMTETVSHIALRKLDRPDFHTIGDTIIDQNLDETLKIKGSITNDKWLVTNDLIKMISNTSFEWMGRKDFVINSGGIKLNPETIEIALSDQIDGSFMVGHLPDDRLGQMAVLLVSGPEQAIDFSNLDRYHRPRKVFFNQIIHVTANNKLDRQATLDQFSETMAKDF